MEYAVICMDYYFSKNIKEDSYIVLGDMSGSVKVMTFSPIERGPFKQEPQRDSLFIRYESVLKVNNSSSETCIIAYVKYAQEPKLTKSHSLLDNRYRQIFWGFRKKFSVIRL